MLSEILALKHFTDYLKTVEIYSFFCRFFLPCPCWL
jgi:hypothetical protein